jgi:hypothetical protein
MTRDKNHKEDNKNINVPQNVNLTRRGSIPSIGKKMFSPKPPHRLWGPPAPYSMGTGGIFTRHEAVLA